jgi:hypothetical protein
MRHAHFGNRLSAILAAGCVAAGGLLALQGGWLGAPAEEEVTPTEATEVAVAEAPADTAGPALVYDPPSLAAYDAILQRPLFLPERRPEEAAPAETPETAATPVATLNLRLEGVAIAAGDRPSDRVAVLRRTATQEVLRLTPGETVDGWKLAEVLADRVVLKGGERSVELLLEIAGSAGRPGARPGAPRPPTRPKR